MIGVEAIFAFAVALIRNFPFSNFLFCLMLLTRILFSFCLLCFVAKQAGYVVGIIQEKECIKLASVDSDTQEKEENVEKQSVNDFFDLFSDKNTSSVFFLISVDSPIPNTASVYSESLFGRIFPPPDSV